MRAIGDTHPDKAPGPDGFPAGFFTSYWGFLGNDVIKEIQEFFLLDTLSPSLNHTLVRLIPKVSAPQKVSDYRPISLCNVFYKFIAKILANRLKPVLEMLISDSQSAFVAGRAISDNVLLTHEVLHYLKRSKARKYCYMAVKTDMSKAYDRLEWSFIKLVLQRFGFHEKWIQWILRCVSSVSYSYLVNGAAQEHVLPTRGIRQGDPLSPYLFILCGEVLSGLCKQAAIRGDLKGITIARGSPSINHLLFADDTMFFTRADEKNSTALLGILQRYEQASGQRINTAKSTITFASKTPADVRNVCKSILHINREGGIGKYLGLPEHFGRRKKDIFSAILDRIRQKIMSWSSKMLSSAGKLTLLKSVLSAIPTYSMSCFKLPVSLCKKIQSLLTRFWWDSNTGVKKMAWISWKKLATPKALGGIGFRDIQKFNDALLAKLSWRILQKPNSLLARVLASRYYVNSSFLECKGTKSASHGWRGILIGRDVLKCNLILSIGDGKKARVWSDPWIPSIPFHRPFGPIPMAADEIKVNELFVNNSFVWDDAKLASFPLCVAVAIKSIVVSKRGGKDKHHWLGTKNGEYTTKSGYYTLVAETSDHYSQTQVHFDWYKWVWKQKCSPKLHLFLWKVLNRALPVGDALNSHGIPGTHICPRCGLDETIRHVLFDCPFARDVWSIVGWKSNYEPRNVSLEEEMMSIIKLIALPPYGIGSGPLAPWILWSLWKSRNLLIFQKRLFSREETFLKAIVDAREWQSAQQTKPTVNSGFSLAKPSHIPFSPPRELPSFFSDAAWSSSFQAAGLGSVLFDPLTERSQNFSEMKELVSSHLLGEGLGILSAMHRAVSLGYSKMQIFSDSKVCVDAINARSSHREIHGVLCDIYSLSLQFESIFFTYISRSLNCVADKLAKNVLRDYLLDKEIQV